MTFAEKLKIALHNRDMTQADLAKRLGVDRSIISQYINGRYEPRASKLIAVSNALNMTPDELRSDIVIDNGSISLFTGAGGIDTSSSNADNAMEKLMQQYGISGETYEHDDIDDFTPNALKLARMYDNLRNKTQKATIMAIMSKMIAEQNK